MQYEQDRKASYLLANKAMTEIANRGFALNPMVFAVFFDLAADTNTDLKSDFSKADGDDRRISQAEVQDLARRHLFGTEQGAVERMMQQFELVLTALSEKLARPLGEEMDSSVKALVKEVAGGELPARVRQAIVGVVKTAKAMSDRDKAVMDDVRKGVENVAELRSELEQARKERDEAKQEARSDQLTGAANRRAFDEAMRGLFGAAGRRAFTASIIALDIDFFKKVNDLYGHDFGDVVLRNVSERLAETLGQSGRLFRLGGEEFGVLLEGTSLLQARQIAERLRMSVAGRMIPEQVASGPQVRVTMSAGVTEKRFNDSAESFIKRVDKALYSSKEQGRDQVTAVP